MGKLEGLIYRGVCKLRIFIRDLLSDLFTKLRNFEKIGFTPDFLSKKHVNIDQGLDFLIFPHGNRGQNVEKP